MITRYPYPTVNSDGRQDVVQHSHPDSSYLHIDYAVTGGTDVDLIIVDLSDTTSYPHSNTSYIHLEEIYIDVDASTNSDYNISVGFLENVDATDGDFYELTHLSGTKTTGQQLSMIRKFAPNGPKCSSTYTLTSDITANDVAFQTDVNLPSTVDPSTADTPSGSGDLVLRITSVAGANTDFNVEINLAYHTH